MENNINRENLRHTALQLAIGGRSADTATATETEKGKVTMSSSNHQAVDSETICIEQLNNQK